MIRYCMAYIDEENKIMVATDKSYTSKIKVLPNNNNTGVFFLGNILTPNFFIGKNVIVSVRILEDE